MNLMLAQKATELARSNRADTNDGLDLLDLGQQSILRYAASLDKPLCLSCAEKNISVVIW